MNNEQSQLVALLKIKGTGPTMSKHLTQKQLESLKHLLKSNHCFLATKATLLIAILMLEKTTNEALWLDHIKQDILPNELHFLIHQKPSNPLEEVVIHLLKHQDLSEKQLHELLPQLFDTLTPLYLKGCILEGLRLKRETFLENKTIFDYILKHAIYEKTQENVVIDLANAYDGFNRTIFFTPFVAAVLSACGYSCVLHSIDEVSPKKGINAFKLLQAANKDVFLSLDEAKQELSNPKCKWTFVHQKHYSPELAQLQSLRTQMVKRPCLTTLEKLVFPLRGKENLLITSYTHPPYKPLLKTLIPECLPTQKTLIVRGQEGSIQLGLDRKTPFVLISEKDNIENFVRPSDFGFEEIPTIEPNKDINAEFCLKEGLQALEKTTGLVFKAIAYNAMAYLHLLGLETKETSKQKVLDALHTKEALAHWNNKK